MDLGTKRNKEGGLAPASPKLPDKSYPSFTLNDKVAEEFCDEYTDYKIGDEVTAKVKLKLTSLRQDGYGHSVGFDVVSIDDVEGSGKSEGEEGKEKESEGGEDGKSGDGDGDEDDVDAEEKTLGYKRTKAKTDKELPDVSPGAFLD